jgi:hypothetical protein
MIVRTRKIKPTSDEIAFTLSLTVADVKGWISRYATQLDNYGMELTETESGLRWWLCHEPSIFGILGGKYADELSAWAVSVSIRHKFIEQSASDTTKFFIAPSLIKKRIGRPPKE